MLSREENELLTRIEPGTPMGNLFRRYWIPALLSEEVPEPDCPPVRVRLLGEDLVAFRASDAFIIQVRRFLLRAVKDFQAGKEPPGVIFDAAQNNFAHLRCEAAHLPANVSWRSLYENGE